MSNTFFSDIKRTFSNGSSLNRFLIINIALFISIKLCKLFFYLLNVPPDVFVKLTHWLAVPANLSVLLFKPWTLFTYMFLHMEFFHILFNMIMLFWFGRIFTEYLGNKKFISTYILGGLAGALLYILAFNVFPVFHQITPSAYALGASASVLAILVAIATYLPNYSMHMILIGPVKLKYIAVFLVVLDLLSIESGNPGGHIAHIGGAIFGFFYIRQLQKGRNIAGWFDKMLDFFGTMSKPKPKIKVVYKRKKTDEEFNTEKKIKQERIDTILDKISKSGYESLTKEEKDILFKMSKNL